MTYYCENKCKAKSGKRKQASFGLVRPILCGGCRDKLRDDEKASFPKFRKQPTCAICDQPPTYGENKKATRCVDHKTPGQYQVYHHYCKADGCKQEASHSDTKIGGKKLYCIEHGPHFGCKYDLKHVTCTFGECVLQASFGINSRVHCKRHALPGETPIGTLVCEKCKSFAMSRGKTLCLYCDPEPRRRKKELSVREYFLSIAMLSVFVHDTSLEDCRFRPDFLFEFNDYCLVVEVDEYCHRSYSDIQELYRMNAIQKALRKRTVFIRFNLDNYTDCNGHRRKFDSPPAHVRLDKLKETMLSYLQDFETQTIAQDLTVCYLFYDGDTDYSIRD